MTRTREHAHVVRSQLRDAGWSVSWKPDGDLCDACRPAPMRLPRDQP